MKDAKFLIGSLIASISYSITIAWIINTPFLFTEKYNFSSMEYGNLQIIIFGSYLLGTQFLRILLNKYTEEVIVTIGVSLLLALSISLVISYIILILGWKSIVLCGSINAFASGIFYRPTTRIIIKASSEKVGVTIAALDLIMLLLGSIISLITSVAVHEGKFLVIVIFTMSLLAFICNFFRQKLGLSTTQVF